MNYDAQTDNPTFRKALYFAELAFRDQFGSMPDPPERFPKAYLAGPMSNIPQFNFPAFDGAAAALREQGFVVVSPAELDDEEERERVMASADGSHDASFGGPPWETYLKRDLQIVFEVDMVVVLPGWRGSKGARLETFVANALGKPIVGEYPQLDAIHPDLLPYQIVRQPDWAIAEGDPTAWADPESLAVGGDW